MLVGKFFIMNRREQKIFNRGLAVGLSEQQHTSREIARRLGCGKTTVTRWIREYRLLQKSAPNKSPGRPSMPRRLRAVIVAHGGATRY